jgi:hypothetical protein
VRQDDFSYSLCCQDTIKISYEQYPLIKKDRSALLLTCIFHIEQVHRDDTMGALEDTVDIMSRLAIANDTPSQSIRDDATALRIKTARLVRVAQRMIRNAEQFIQNLDTGGVMDEKLTTLKSVSRDTARLTDIMASLDDTPVDMVVAHISSLSQQNVEVSKLLSYFREEIKTITRDILGSATDGEPKFLRIL